MKIRTRLLVLVLGTVSIIFLSFVLLTYYSGRKLLIVEIENSAKSNLDKHICEINGKLKNIENVANSIGIAIEDLKPINEDEVKALISDMLTINPDVYGSTTAFEPATFAGKEYFAPYFFKKNDKLVYNDLAKVDYNYTTWDWYSIPLKTKHSRWSEPYFDTGGGDISMITYSRPFFLNGVVWGVTTVDVSIDYLVQEIDDIKIGETGFAFIISEKGTIVSSKFQEDEFKKTIFDISKETNSEELNRLGNEMTSGKSGFTSFLYPGLNKKSWFAYGPIKTINWSVGIVLPESELLSDLQDYNRNILLLSLLGILILSIMIFIISKKISLPIVLLAKSANQLASGDFSAEIKVCKRNDEICNLSKAFLKMRESIKDSFYQINKDKELFKIAFSQMTDGVVITNSDFKPVQHNQTAERLLYMPTNNTILEQLKINYDCSVPFDSLVNSNPRTTFKLSRKKSDNSDDLHLSCTLVSIYDNKRVLSQRLLILRDITEFEKEEKSKKSFLSLMSHKFFTPLTVLQGKLMLFKDGLLGETNEKQKSNIDSMVNQTAKLKSLIENLVNYVNVDETKLDESKEPIDLNMLMNALKTEYLSWYADKKPELDVKIKSDSPVIEFNKKYLSTVIGQLIDNAIKFNLSTPPKVDIEIKKDNGILEIQITDNGIGIPAEHLEHVFDKFYQIEKYYTGNIEGVGLGLSYVKNIVEHFGGKIIVESKPGVGSRFTFSVSV